MGVFDWRNYCCTLHASDMRCFWPTCAFCTFHEWASARSAPPMVHAIAPTSSHNSVYVTHLYIVATKGAHSLSTENNTCTGDRSLLHEFPRAPTDAAKIKLKFVWTADEISQLLSHRDCNCFCNFATGFENCRKSPWIFALCLKLTFIGSFGEKIIQISWFWSTDIFCFLVL